jgi:uncharacterized membrane protein YbaN (DUF454 family)
MSEASILLGEKKLIEVGPYRITFTPPTVEWWLRFADIIGTSLSSLAGNPSLITAAFRLRKSTDKVLEAVASTTDWKPDRFRKDMTLPQLAKFIDLWVGSLDLDTAKGFFEEAGKKVQAVLPAIQ